MRERGGGAEVKQRPAEVGEEKGGGEEERRVKERERDGGREDEGEGGNDTNKTCGLQIEN